MTTGHSDQNPQERQHGMAGLTPIKLEITAGEACQLATAILHRRRKIDRNREANAKKRGGYYVPPEGKKDMDLKRMDDLARLAARLIKNVPDEWLNTPRLVALKNAREDGLSLYDALKGHRQEPPTRAERTDG